MRFLQPFDTATWRNRHRTPRAKTESAFPPAQSLAPLCSQLHLPRLAAADYSEHPKCHSPEKGCKLYDCAV